MIYNEDCTLPKEYLEQLSAEGMEALPEMIQVLINQTMQIERTKHIQAEPYERKEERSGHSNGFKPKTVRTRMGEITFAVPQVREGGFYPGALEKGLRSERALTLTLAEMYACTVPQAQACKEYPPGKWQPSPSNSAARKYPPAKSVGPWNNWTSCWKPGEAGAWEKWSICTWMPAILIASGVQKDGKRAILGISVSLSEAETHWRVFLEELVGRGLHGVCLIISDDHGGLEAARKAVFSGVPWQRCQFHLQQNAQSYVPRVGMRREVAEDIRTIFGAPDQGTAEKYLKETVKKYAVSAPKLADWMEVSIPEGFTVFSFPRDHWHRIRTTNSLERLSQEIKRRTRVVRVFPNEQSCLRLISYEFGKVYLEMGSG